MTYRQKADKFKELIYRINIPPTGNRLRWQNKEELSAYLERFGGSNCFPP